MSEWIIETRYLDPERSSQITVGHAPGRVRSASEVYSFDTSVLDCDNQDSRKNSDDGRLINFLSPTDSSRSIIGNQGEQTPNDNEITSGRFVVGSLHNSHSHLTTETRGRLFSELSLSDLPSEGNGKNGNNPCLSIENPISLDISFPCSYEENMELRCKTIVQLRKGSIKRVVVCAGYIFDFLLFIVVEQELQDITLYIQRTVFIGHKRLYDIVAQEESSEA